MSSLIAQAQILIDETTTKPAYITPTNIEQVKLDLEGVLKSAVCRAVIITQCSIAGGPLPAPGEQRN